MHISLKKSYEYFESFSNITTELVPCNNAHTRNVQMEFYDLEMFLSCDLAFGLWNYNNIYIWKTSNIEVLVPVVHEKLLTFSINILYSFLTFSGLIILTILYTWYYKFNREEWSILNIFQLMLGNSASTHPHSRRSKIVYMVLAMFSIFCISDIITDLTEVKYKSEEVLLVETIDDVLNKKNISICACISNLIADYYISSTTVNVQRMFKLLDTKCSKMFGEEFLSHLTHSLTILNLCH